MHLASISGATPAGWASALNALDTCLAPTSLLKPPGTQPAQRLLLYPATFSILKEIAMSNLYKQTHRKSNKMKRQDIFQMKKQEKYS